MLAALLQEDERGSVMTTQLEKERLLRKEPQKYRIERKRRTRRLVIGLGGIAVLAVIAVLAFFATRSDEAVTYSTPPVAMSEFEHTTPFALLPGYVVDPTAGYYDPIQSRFITAVPDLSLSFERVEGYTVNPLHGFYDPVMSTWVAPLPGTTLIELTPGYFVDPAIGFYDPIMSTWVAGVAPPEGFYDTLTSRWVGPVEQRLTASEGVARPSWKAILPPAGFIEVAPGYFADPAVGYYDPNLGTWVPPMQESLVFELLPGYLVDPTVGYYDPNLGTWVPPI